MKKSVSQVRTAFAVLATVAVCAAGLPGQQMFPRIYTALAAGTVSSGNGVISINFVGSATPMGSTEVAGVVPRSHWNEGSGFASSSPLSLVDETGSSTGASVV